MYQEHYVAKKVRKWGGWGWVGQREEDEQVETRFSRQGSH